MALQETLLELGFELDEDGRSAAQSNAETQGMASNGAYEVQQVFVKGDVVVSVEQNQAPEPMSGLSAVVTHPATAVIASPKGRLAFNPSDLELAVGLVAELS